MTITKVLISALAIASAPAMASQSTATGEGAPQASPDALYCLRVEAATGTRLESVQCFTREQWTELEVDVDQDWAREGVRVIDASRG